MVRCGGYVDEEQGPVTGSSSSSSGGHQRHAASDAYPHLSRSSSSMSLRKMDKSSVLRSTIDFLKRYYDAKKISQAAVQSDADKEMEEEVESNDSWKPPFLSYEEFGYLMLDVSTESRFHFISLLITKIPFFLKMNSGIGRLHPGP